MKQIPGFCSLCRSHCGTINIVKDGALIEVRPDPDHPTGKAVCMKGKAGPEIIAGQNRLLYPMRRTRPKTEVDPGWERISWEEAYSICAERLGAIRRESGAESVAFAATTQSGTGIADSIQWVQRFIRVFGSPNSFGSAEICNWHKDTAHRFTFGVGIPTADYARSDLIMLWGHNPTSTWLAQSEAIQRGRLAGAKSLVIDPRPIPLATSADLWLRVRPGTDAALAMGLSALLIDKHGFDENFIRAWTNGPLLVDNTTGMFIRPNAADGSPGKGFLAWDTATSSAFVYDTDHALDAARQATVALRGEYAVPTAMGPVRCSPAFDLFARACKTWTPDRVHEATGISPDQLNAAAALIAGSRKIAYHAWNGVGQSENATQTERGIATLYALTGSFDIAGGNRIFAKLPVHRVDSLDLLSNAQRAKAIGLAARPLGPAAEGRIKSIDAFRAMRDGVPYKIRALFGFGSNHLLTHGDTAEMVECLQSVEFHVHCDIVETPTLRYADIVLPVNTPWEREALQVGFEINEEAEDLVMLRPVLSQPRGEARSDLDIVFDLACRLGHGDMFFNGDTDAAMNHMLEPLGITVGDLRNSPRGIRIPQEHRIRKYAQLRPDGGVTGFSTPSRRVELYSELLLSHGYSPLPQHVERKPDSPSFPLVLTSMKNGYYCHSQHRAISSLRLRAPSPTVTMHPSLAQRHQLSVGDTAIVQSEAGEARFIVSTDEGLDESVMAAEFGWWEGAEPLGLPGTGIFSGEGFNFNALVSAKNRDPISGSVNHKSVPCRLLPRSNSLGRNDFHIMRVADMRREGNAMAVSLESDSGLPLPDFLPGQHLQLRLNVPDRGTPVVRAYSLTSASIDPARAAYTICVGLDARMPEQPGVMSSHVHQKLSPGDLVAVKLPTGKFTIPTQSGPPLVFIATGIGITPFISHLESSLGVNNPARVLLLNGNFNGQTQAFKSRLKEISSRHPALQILDFYSKPLPDDIKGVDYTHSGTLSARFIDTTLIEQGARFYLCGSAGMIKQLTSELQQRGVPRFNIFSELFAVPRRNVPALGSFTVEFRRSGVSTTWTTDRGTLMDVAEANGVRVSSGCRVGQCESCQAQILDGDAYHLVDRENEQPGSVLICQSVPTSDLVLDL